MPTSFAAILGARCSGTCLDVDKWFVIWFHPEVRSKYVGMEPLATKHNCQELSLDVCISLFCFSECFAGKCDGLAIMQQCCPQSLLRSVYLDCSGFLGVEIGECTFSRCFFFSGLRTISGVTLYTANHCPSATGLSEYQCGLTVLGRMMISVAPSLGTAGLRWHCWELAVTGCP